jgi:hypothetical protein
MEHHQVHLIQISPIHITPYSLSLRSILILSTHLHTDLIGLFPLASHEYPVCIPFVHVDLS